MFKIGSILVAHLSLFAMLGQALESETKEFHIQAEDMPRGLSKFEWLWKQNPNSEFIEVRTKIIFGDWAFYRVFTEEGKKAYQRYAESMNDFEREYKISESKIPALSLKEWEGTANGSQQTYEQYKVSNLKEFEIWFANQKNPSYFNEIDGKRRPTGAGLEAYKKYVIKEE